MTTLRDFIVNGDVADTIDWIVNFDVENLFDRKIFGETLNDVSEKFINLQNYLALIDINEWEKFSSIDNATGTPEAIHEDARSVVDIVAKIQEQKNTKNVEALRDDCVSDLKSIYNGIVNSTHQIMGIIKKQKPIETKSIELEKVQENAESLLAEITSLKEESQQNKEHIEQILQGATTQASKSGVAQEAKHFQTEANKHDKNVRKWLKAVIGATTTLLTVAFCFYLEGPSNSNGIDWNHFIPRFSILGLLIFIDAVLIGNYRAERHNAIVNQHRANALNTFETMTAATLTQDVKDAITLTVAGAIYAPQDTGYSKRGIQQMPSIADILTSIATDRN